MNVEVRSEKRFGIIDNIDGIFKAQTGLLNSRTVCFEKEEGIG